LAAIAVGCLAAACSTVAPVPTPTPIPTPVIAAKPTYVVQRGTVTDEVVVSGRFAATQEEKVYFRVDGRVAAIHVKPGDTVRKGDLLAELETGDLQNQLAQAQLTLQQAEIRLKSAQDNVAEQQVQLDIALETARLRLAQTRARDPRPNIDIAAATRDKAAAALQAAQAAYDRHGRVSGSAEALALQRATSDYEIAVAQYALAEQSLETWYYEIRILEQAVLLAESNIRKAALSLDPVLQQDVAKAQLAVERLNGQISTARLTAPVDGEVTMIALQVGKPVQAYSTAMTVAAPGALDVTVSLPDQTLKQLSIGQPVSVSFVNYPGRDFPGTIVGLPYPYGVGSPDTDRLTRIAVQADVPIQQGTLATVRIVLQQRTDVLWLPPAAIRKFQGRDFVVVQDGEVQSRLPVFVGLATEERVEITDGVAEGQIVIGP